MPARKRRYFDMLPVGRNVTAGEARMICNCVTKEQAAETLALLMTYRKVSAQFPDIGLTRPL